MLRVLLHEGGRRQPGTRMSGLGESSKDLYLPIESNKDHDVAEGGNVR